MRNEVFLKVKENRKRYFKEAKELNIQPEASPNNKSDRTIISKGQNGKSSQNSSKYGRPFIKNGSIKYSVINPLNSAIQNTLNKIKFKEPEIIKSGKRQLQKYQDRTFSHLLFIFDVDEKDLQVEENNTDPELLSTGENFTTAELLSESNISNPAVNSKDLPIVNFVKKTILSILIFFELDEFSFKPFSKTKPIFLLKKVKAWTARRKIKQFTYLPATYFLGSFSSHLRGIAIPAINKFIRI